MESKADFDSWVAQRTWETTGLHDGFTWIAQEVFSPTNLYLCGLHVE